MSGALEALSPQRRAGDAGGGGGGGLGGSSGAGGGGVGATGDVAAGRLAGGAFAGLLPMHGHAAAAVRSLGASGGMDGPLSVSHAAAAFAQLAGGSVFGTAGRKRRADAPHLFAPFGGAGAGCEQAAGVSHAGGSWEAAGGGGLGPMCDVDEEGGGVRGGRAGASANGPFSAGSVGGGGGGAGRPAHAHTAWPGAHHNGGASGDGGDGRSGMAVVDDDDDLLGSGSSPKRYR